MVRTQRIYNGRLGGTAAASSTAAGLNSVTYSTISVTAGPTEAVARRGLRGVLDGQNRLYPTIFDATAETNEIEKVALGSAVLADDGKAIQTSILIYDGTEGEIITSYQIDINQLEVNLLTGFLQPALGANATITLPAILEPADRDFLNSDASEIYIQAPDGSLRGYYRTVGVGTAANTAGGTITATLLDPIAAGLVRAGEYNLADLYGTGTYNAGAKITGRTGIIPATVNGNAFVPPTEAATGHVQCSIFVANTVLDNAIAGTDNVALKQAEARAAVYSYVPAALFEEVGPVFSAFEQNVIYLTYEQAQKVRLFGRGSSPNLVKASISYLTGDIPRLG